MTPTDRRRQEDVLEKGRDGAPVGAFSDAPRHDWASHYADALRYMCAAARHLEGPPKPKDKLPPGIPVPDLTMDQWMDIEDGPPHRDRV